MQPLQFAVPLDGLESVADVLPHVIFALVLVTMATRMLANRHHRREAADGAESLSRYYPHWAASVLLVLVTFAYMVVHQHAGMIMSALVLGTFISDFFEFEAREVEARNEMAIERPNGAIFASAVLFLYAAFQSVFFIIKPIWTAII
ncbi:MAG: hypothetical protein ABEJ74_05385 [Haloferacaceae archaeon]